MLVATHIMYGYCSLTCISARHRRRATFDLLPQNVLLNIFDIIGAYEGFMHWRWDRVAHVCRAWRSVVLSSPRRLNLRLLCTYRKPVVDILHHWWHLPISIHYRRDDSQSLTPEDEDNIIHALQHSFRIFEISLTVTLSLAAKLATVPWTRNPYPMLVDLELFCPKGGPEVTLPKGFLNASAPSLEHIFLNGVVIPSLPRILASAEDLEVLSIVRTPQAGYFSPAALIPRISAMSHLCDLNIHYLLSASHPQAIGRARSPPSLIPVILLSLERFSFQGASEDLEDLVSRFVAPRLKSVTISLHNQLIISDLPHLALFLSRCDALVHCTDVKLTITRGSGASLEMSDKVHFHWGVECKALDWQISTLAQICTPLHHFSPSTKTGLNILFDDSRPNPRPVPEPDQDEPEPDQWLELLQPFNTVEELSVSDGSGVSNGLFQALRTLPSGGEGTLSVLPALRELRLEVDSDEQSDAVAEVLDPFVEARRLIDRPVTISYHTRESLRPYYDRPYYDDRPYDPLFTS
ncbi:hypothetical protein BC834DRAFT_58979 [Gloeopeniophorella convolvens]|nr:hypothetical protein BC834DRAFT_58979 [Gloeopeniophorella convolvens]